MKNNLFVLALTAILMVGCSRSEEPEEVRIDQLLRVYYKDTEGRDLIEEWQKAGADPMRWEDLLAIRAGENVSYLNRKDSLGINFIEYQAGATRVETSEGSVSDRSFITQIRINYSTDSLEQVRSDTLQIRYVLSPNTFFISEVHYNQKLLPMAPFGNANVVTVVK